MTVLLGSVVAVLFVIFIVSRFFAKKSAKKKEAQRVLSSLHKTFNEEKKRVLSLQKMGIFRAEGVLFAFSLIKARIDPFVMSSGVRKPGFIISKGNEFIDEIRDTMSTLLENEEAKKFVDTVSEEILDEYHDISVWFSRALSALEFLKKEAPENVWKGFEDLKTKVPMEITDSKNLMENAENLASMKVQDFKQGKKYALQAIEKAIAINKKLLSVVREKEGWVRAKEIFAESFLSKEWKEKFVEMATENDNIVNWLTVANLVVSEQGRLSSYED